MAVEFQPVQRLLNIRWRIAMVKGHNKLPVCDNDAASADFLVCVCVCMNDMASRYKTAACNKQAGN